MKSKMALSQNLRILFGLLRFGLVLVCGVALGGQAPAPVRADVSLNIGIMDLSGLDPALTTAGSALEVTSQIYETLVTVDPGGTLPKAGIAQSWSASTDGLTWTFTLRAGLKFHDGTDLDAAAVAANFERWWDPANAYHAGSFEPFASLFGGFKGDPNCLLTGVSAPNSAQVVLTLARPYGPILTILTMPAFGIASPAAIAAGTLSTNPVGSGPYRFVEWIPADHISLTNNAAYWGSQPMVGSLVFTLFNNENDLVTALGSNAVQIAPYLSTTSYDLLKTNPAVTSRWKPAGGIGYMGINRGHTPLNNLLVRQAIAHAINKASLISTLYGSGDQASAQFLPPSLMGYKTSITDYGYDPVLAQNLLAQAGYPNGFSTTLSYRNVIRSYLPNPAGTAARIQADLAAVGISVTINVYDSNTFLGKVYAGELDLFLLGWGADFMHPDNFMTPVLCGGNLAFGAQDTTLCNTISSARVESSLSSAQILYETAEQRIQETLPLVSLVNVRSYSAARKDLVGFVPSQGSHSYSTVTYATNWVYLPSTRR